MYKKRVLATVITVFITGIVFGITIVEKCDIRSLRAALIVLCVAAAVCCAVFSRAGDDRRYKRATAVAVAVAAFSCGGLRVALQADIGSAGAGFIGAEDNAVMSIVSAESDHYDCELVKSDIGVPSGKYIRYYLRTGEENGIAGDIITAKVVYASAASRSCRAADIFLSASGSVSAREQGSVCFTAYADIYAAATKRFMPATMRCALLRTQLPSATEAVWMHAYICFSALRAYLIFLR